MQYFINLHSSLILCCWSLGTAAMCKCRLITLYLFAQDMHKHHISLVNVFIHSMYDIYGWSVWTITSVSSQFKEMLLCTSCDSLSALEFTKKKTCLLWLLVMGSWISLLVRLIQTKMSERRVWHDNKRLAKRVFFFKCRMHFSVNTELRNCLGFFFCLRLL